MQPAIGERQLFVDDSDISEVHGLRATLHEPEKKGAVIRPDMAALEGRGTMQVRSTPFWDQQDELFRYVVTDTDGPTSVNMLWESRDGYDWSLKPIGLDGDRTFKAEVGDRTAALYALLSDPPDIDSPDRRFKSLTSHPHSSKHMVPITSPDLLRWELNDETPFRSADEWNLSYDPVAQVYIATPKVRGVYGRSVGLSTSRDYDYWTQSELMFQTDELDQELAQGHIDWYMKTPTLYSQSGKHDYWNWHNVDIYNMGVFRYETLYLGMPAFFHRFGPGKDRDGQQYAFTFFPLVCSRDLREWKRVGERRPFMRPSNVEGGAFDLAKSQPPSNAIVRDDELWLYYNGLRYSGWSPKPDKQEDHRGAVCLAVLRRDGFVSMDAGEDAGVLITRTLTVPDGARQLCVNAAAPGGELRGAILDDAGQAFEDFCVAEEVRVPAGKTLTHRRPRMSDPVGIDSVRTELAFSGHSDLSQLAGRQVRLRFSLRQAELYSYWFE